MHIIFEKIRAFLRRLLSLEENTLDYMVALPNPLDADEEARLLEASASGDPEARNKLVEHNLRLVVYIAKRFDNTGMDMEELVSVGTMGLIKAVRSYNGDKKIKLATYASRCIENEILMYLRKMVKTRNEVSLDEPLNVDWEGNKLLLSDVLGTDGGEVYKEMEADVEKNILREIFSKLDERDRAIICMRYGLYGVKERTQKEIADMMNISQSYISRLEKKIIDKLKAEYLKTEGRSGI
ncbi:MAG: RNA polymerase sporulation sigma factor SigK [Firmicutes bacterium]|uniref:RNA polymerase sigma factor n=1 Tax=Candidatus Stercoripulliclostridium pullicola TaxID=2840953 RepID=A0A940DIQ2_9FIRM|nr:RNA polymerase sporulation sigma factor SigK [Candidatus Stercoripulliclostridium pullicola]